MNTLNFHSVLETHIDVPGQQLVVTMGSWPDVADGSYWTKATVPLHIPVWLPEYGTRAEEFVFSSPEWGGAGPARPSDLHLWAPLTLAWHLPAVALQTVKDAQWSEIKQARAIAECAGFEWDGSRFQSGVTSQQRINTKVLLAMGDAGFSIDWILADNTSRTLTAAHMAAVGAALDAHLTAQFRQSQVLRAAIDAADTIDAVRAVVWSKQ